MWECTEYNERGERITCGTAHRTYRAAQQHAKRIRRMQNPRLWQPGWAPPKRTVHIERVN